MKKITCLLAASLPILAFAHPGHGGSDGYTIIHYFSEPQHAIISLAVMAAAIVLIVRERNKRKA
jgi:hypothetical protein